ncbi:MAG: hypothetical protein II752_02360, partial [Muribaculaceae bacterium]|nr:hypothetical protein [Muribaculaceae bacterium]
MALSIVAAITCLCSSTALAQNSDDLLAYDSASKDTTSSVDDEIAAAMKALSEAGAVIHPDQKDSAAEEQVDINAILIAASKTETAENALANATAVAALNQATSTNESSTKTVDSKQDALQNEQTLTASSDKTESTTNSQKTEVSKQTLTASSDKTESTTNSQKTEASKQ